MSVSLSPITSFPRQPQAGGGDSPLGTAQLVSMPDRLQNIPRSITLSAYIVSIENEVTRARVSAGDILMRASVPLMPGKPILIQLAPGTPPTFAVLFAISSVGAVHDSPLAAKAPATPPPQPTTTGQTTPGTPSFATSGFGALLEMQENREEDTKPGHMLPEPVPEPPDDPTITLDS